jgi:hypothetical protein
MAHPMHPMHPMDDDRLGSAAADATLAIESFFQAAADAPPDALTRVPNLHCENCGVGVDVPGFCSRCNDDLMGQLGDGW